MKDPCSAYVALGSNLGDREGYLCSAVGALRQLGELRAVSSLYETEPIGTVPQSDFLNAAVELQTTLQPEELLAELLRIEQERGRDRSRVLPKGPRTLDLDLLSFGALVLETPILTLPHPAMAERRFVLVPLAEIAPQWRHPVGSKTAAQMLAELDRKYGGDLPRVRKVPKQK